jgi:hypothetical protein
LKRISRSGCNPTPTANPHSQASVKQARVRRCTQLSHRSGRLPGHLSTTASNPFLSSRTSEFSPPPNHHQNRLLVPHAVASQSPPFLSVTMPPMYMYNHKPLLVSFTAPQVGRQHEQSYEEGPPPTQSKYPGRVATRCVVIIAPRTIYFPWR